MFVELLGMRSGSRAAAQHFCHVSAERLEALLAEPAVVELLLTELGCAPPAPGSPTEAMALLRRQAIHWSLSVGSPYSGLSVEEVVVMCAYRCTQLDGTPWKRFLTRVYTAGELELAARRWLREQALVPDGSVRPWRGRWLLGRHPQTEKLVALTFALEARRLHHELAWLAYEADFAHESYLVCSMPTALGFIDVDARASRTQRVDTRAIEHQLRTRGLGLLIVDMDRTWSALPPCYREAPSYLDGAVRALGR
jgi:hypothetical protein